MSGARYMTSPGTGHRLCCWVFDDAHEGAFIQLALQIGNVGKGNGDLYLDARSKNEGMKAST